MQIDKGMLLDLLRQQGQGDRVAEADRELPDRVDTEDEGQLGILRKFGIDPGMISSLLDKLPPGIADKLPGGLGKLL
jgi:hypothetical protein